MIVGLIVFGLVLMLFMLLFLISSKRYSDYIEPLDSSEYKLKRLLPVGLCILDIIKYKYTSKYDRMLQSKVAELKGMKYSVYYLQIHHANKIVLMFLMLLLFSLLSAVTQDVATLVFGIAVTAAVPYFMDRELSGKVNRRRLSIQLDFPDFLNKVILLVNAGMTVSRAWEKSVTDSEKDTVLYQELRTVLADIREVNRRQALLRILPTGAESLK